MKHKTMLNRYAAETDSGTKDRMMPVIKVKYDAMDIRDAAKSIGKSGLWGYKWYDRYAQVGFDLLADQSRTGRPPKVDGTLMKNIRKGSCRKLVWTGREMQDHIKAKTGTKYAITHVRHLLRSWGYSQKVPAKIHASRVLAEASTDFKRMYLIP